MTPDQIIALRQQLGLSQAGLADALNDLNPLLRANRQTVYRWEGGSPQRTPNVHSADALARLWLHHGYPVRVTMRDGTHRDGTLTTDHSASSYGQPVVVIDGVPHGSGDVAGITLTSHPLVAGGED